EPSLAAPGSDKWLTILDNEGPNMMAAVEQALATDPRVAMRIAVAHTFYWTFRGRVIEGEAALSAVLEAVPDPSALRARALWGRAFVLLHGAGRPGVISIAQEAIDLAERFGDLSTAARAYQVIGSMQVF